MSEFEKFVQLHVPISPEDRRNLRRIANDLGVTYGLLARTLILEGLDHHQDQNIQDRLTAEKKIDGERRRQAGRKAISERWEKEEGN